MKVLFLLSIGLDRQATSGHLLNAIIKALCENGHSVHIIQKYTNGDLPSIPKELESYNVTTDTVPFEAAEKGNFIARYLKELKYIRACKKLIKSGYDAVFVQSTTIGGFAVKALRKKLPKAIVTFNVQDIFPYNLVYSGKVKKNGVVFTVLSAIQRNGYKLSDHIITISEDMKDLLVEDGTPAEKIEVIYNWSYQDKPYENIDLTPVSHMFSKKYFNVVYAGNIGVLQNVAIIIEAARLMKNEKDVWFHIIGNGVYKEKLESRAKGYEITNISFWPMQPSKLAPVIYSAADMNVIPLVKDVYRTALPSKTAICMACGKPIIFAIGKNSKFGQRVEKEAGCVVVNSDDARVLVEAISLIKAQENPSEVIKAFFETHMGLINNSMRYSEIITGGKF